MNRRFLSLALALLLAVGLFPAIPAFAAAEPFVGYFNPDRPGQYLPGDLVVEPDTGVVGRNIVATPDGNAWGVGPSAGNGYFEVVGAESDLLDLLAEAELSIPEFTREKTWTKGDLVQLDGGYYRSLADSTGTVADENVQSPADPDYGWGFWAPVNLLPLAAPVGYWNEALTWNAGDRAIEAGVLWECLTDGVSAAPSADAADAWERVGSVAQLAAGSVVLPKWNGADKWPVGALVTYQGAVYTCTAKASGAAQGPENAAFWKADTALDAAVLFSDKDLAVYLPNWGASADAAYIANLPWDRMTTVNYAFYEILPDFTLADTAPDLHDTLFAALEENNALYPEVDVVVSVGGWNDCGYFSDMAKNAENRKIFIDSCLALLDANPWLAGVDIDWEYPGIERAGTADGSDQGNKVQPDGSDGANYTALLQELRAALDETYGEGAKKLTVCAPADPKKIIAADGHVHQDVAVIAEVLDRINIMTYDFVVSTSDTTNHQSNLTSTESTVFSTKRIVELFQEQGVPEGKINIGTPLYANCFSDVTADNAAASVNKPSSAAYVAPVKWNELKSYEVSPALGYETYYDEAADAAVIFHKDKGMFYSYENERSLQAKLDYIDAEDLGGLIVWEATGDGAEWDFPMLTQMSRELGLYGGAVAPYEVEPMRLPRVGMWTDTLEWLAGDYALNPTEDGGIIVSLCISTTLVGADANDESPTGTDAWGGYGNGRWTRLGTVAQLGAVFTDPAYADAAATVPAFSGSHKWYVGEIVSLDGQYYVALGESAGKPNENIESPADPDYGWGKWEPISTGGVKVTVLGEAVTVSAEGDAAAPAAVTLPEDVDAAKLTTMAIAREDETYAPVPTRVDEDGGVTVLVRGEVSLVPLNVEAAFPDTDLGEAYANVTAEIHAAAAKMIVNGRESGAFDPAARVTAQEAVIMFLRAMGVPVQPLTAMDTGAEQGLVAADAAPTAPVTRGDTAVLVANALTALGLEPTLDDGEADELLAEFSDVSGLNAEQRDALALCVKLGILTGYGGTKAGQIGANDALQRSQMASITVRLQGLYWE